MIRWLIVAVALCACNQAPAAPGPHFGDVMTQVGRRFELLGRAMQARRWELADFELGELRESFDDIPTAQIPRDVKADVRQLARGFVPTIEASLQEAVAKRDTAAAATSFASAAQVCNACHQASARRFIEVPDKLGEAVPRLDALP